jgi:hypothetical protein
MLPLSDGVSKIILGWSQRANSLTFLRIRFEYLNLLF